MQRVRDSPMPNDISYHPLLIPKVVENVLGYLRVEEWKKFRLISQIWNKECCGALQSQRQISFSNATSVANYIEIFGGNNDNISSPLQPLCPLTPRPFPHAIYHFTILKMNLIFDSYVLRKFFRLFGSLINSLYLDVHGRLFRTKFFRIGILENLNNLKHLRITFKDCKELWPGGTKDDHEILPLWTLSKFSLYSVNNGVAANIGWRVPLGQILASLPNLSIIECGNGLGELIFEILYKNSLTLPNPPLTHLNFDLLTLNHIQNIIELGLPLTTLEAEVHPLVDKSHIINLLTQLAPTLMKLKLSSTNFLTFPDPSMVMRLLVNLEIIKCHCDLNIFDIKDKFPVLRRLKFKFVDLTYSGVKKAQIIQDIEKDSNYLLESLTLERCEGLFSIIPIFGSIFQKIRKLNVDIPETAFKSGDNILGLICEWMPNLEELFLCQDSLNDESVTGISQEICAKVLERLKFGGKAPPFQPNNLRNKSNWIGQLKGLIVLELRSVELSDFGVIYGITNCKSLQRLTLHSPYWLTNLSLKAIGDHLSQNLLTLDLFCSNQVTDSGLNDLRNKMKGKRCLISENKFSFEDTESSQDIQNNKITK